MGVSQVEYVHIHETGLCSRAAIISM